MNKIIAESLKTAKDMLDQYERNCLGEVEKISRMIIDCYENKGTVYLCGNGGSACDAQHIAGELVGRYLINREPLSAAALTTDGSLLTCLGNDFSFETVFEKQVQGLGRAGDILWAFSCSGGSENVIRAVKAAKSKQMKVVGFTGRKGTELEKLSDGCVWVDAPFAGPAQQVHMVAYHAICQIVEEHFFAGNK